MTLYDSKKAKPSLGRGLSALLGESFPGVNEAANGDITQLPVSQIRPGQYQPRQQFNVDKLESLIESVREKGIIQPLIVRAITTDQGKSLYEIIAGERRWRAAKTLDFDTVPVIVRDLNDQEALETAIVENIQRDDLTPIEEAEAYQRLLTEFNYTQEQLAQAIGKSRSHVANTLRLNQLPTETKNLIHAGKISAGHARTLLTALNPEALTQQILTEKLNVRETERLAKQPVLELPPSETEQQTAQLQAQISQLLKLKTSLKISKSGAVLSVHFSSFEEIDDFINRLHWYND